MAAKRKTTKRAPKKTPKVSDVAVVEMTSVEAIDTATVRKVGTKTKLAILLAVVVIAIVLYVSKGYFIAATVNGQIVSRPQVISLLEKQSGKQTLDSLITENIISQEAKKAGVSVSDDDLKNEIKTIEDSVKSQGQDLDTLLTMQGMTRDELNKQIRIQKLVEKLLGDKVMPTDQEIDDYMKQNKDLLPKDKSEDEIHSQVVDQLKQQKLSTQFQTWITDIKSKANIKYYVNY